MLLSQALFTGTQVNYYIVCPTKLWLFTHQLSMEASSEYVEIGKFIHEKSYSRERKDVIIDEKIGIDFIRDGDKLIICEIKKSKRIEKAHRYQLYYYLYYLRKIKGIENVEGRILYPTQREIEVIEFNEEISREIEKIMEEIRKIISLDEPPKPSRKSYCKKCAYFEFCWV
ncbi:MAG: CRISPR-associated protein Cas4 [Thermoplasmatales archaeon]|nr:CRISPR-associated protein Cas4 [Thermoplasmatales archaeon]